MANSNKGWVKSGDPWVWMIGGALSISVVMVAGLLLLILIRGFSHFWPAPIVEMTATLPDGTRQQVLAQIQESETMPAERMREAGMVVAADVDVVTRHLYKIGNRDQFGSDFTWHAETAVTEWEYPRDAVMLERREWGDFYGFLERVKEGGETVAEGEAAWPELQERLRRSNRLIREVRHLERSEIGRINLILENARLDRRRVDFLGDSLSDAEREQRLAEIAAVEEAANAEYDEIRVRRNDLRARAQRDSAVFRISDGREVTLPLATIIQATRNNDMSVLAKVRQYVRNFWDFVSGYPREANTEGGIFPAIFGTVTMVLLMSIVVTPFGVMAAIYLREYAKEGPVLRVVRVSVYNLAGVPSIVFGVFGLGFFIYTLGGNIDALFFPERLPQPTFGTGGLLWASLTLALLTLPVVIVSTEEGLARIPRTLREGSLALGATKAETLWRVIVPMSAPAMMTGLILAVARAAGEVAPLMLVGVVKLAPTLPIDSIFPYIHLERKIMHLGFHIYDVGFQSPNAEAARPLVYATALMLVLIIVVLNLTAISIRNRLRERYRADSD